jgi:tetratricopeptide (TPR) repeat protein
MAKKQNLNTAPRPAAPAKPAPKQMSQLEKEPKKSLSLHWKLGLILAAIAFLIYGNTLSNGFVLDDPMVLSKNNIVTKGFAGIPELLHTPRLKGYGYMQNENYRPLSLIMFAIEYELSGGSAFINHFFNVLFFAGCVLMLFFFLDKFFDRKRTGVAFMAALLFALHPIHTEVVANIKSRDEIMCFFFGFWALNVFVDYMKQGKTWMLIAGTALYFLSFISKETVIAFLFVIPLMFFLYHNDSRKRAIYITACAVVIAAIYTALRITILKANNTYNPNAIDFMDNILAGAPSVATRMATAMFILGQYLKLMFVPYPLICDYCYNSIPFVGFGNIWVLITVALYTAMGAYSIYRLTKDRKDPWAFGILFYLSTLFLFSNLPFLIGAAMGERFLFFASVGFCLVVALAIEKFVLKEVGTYSSVMRNKMALAVLIPICLAYTVITFGRNAEWKDNYTLFKADVAKAPNDARLYFYYGDELAENIYPAETDTAKQRAAIEEGIDALQKAVAIYPKYAEAHVELGKAYFMRLNYDSAAAHFITALKENPSHSVAANNLGTIYLRTGKYREAIALYQSAIKVNVQFVQAYYNLGCTYIQTKQFDSAIHNLNMALRFDPNYAPAYMQIGMAYFSQNQYDKAESFLKKSMEMDPNNTDVINNLGAIYLNTGKTQQALEMFRKTVAINPNYVNGYANMGHCYYQMKQFQDAINSLSKALQLDPNAVKEIPYIALSFRGLGNMAEARKYEAIAQRYYSNFKLDEN